MKLSIKPLLLKYMILGCGAAGFALRMVLYTTGIDEKGLLISGYWAGTALWLLTALAAAMLLIFSRPIQGPELYRDAHPVSVPGGISSLGLAAAIALATLAEYTQDEQMQLIRLVVGIGAAAALVYIAFCRLCGMKPLFLAHALVCVCFALRMVSGYRHWSSDPQLMNYAFYLGAYVALMLTAYQQTAFDADMGNHRVLWGTSLAAVFLCGVSLKGAADFWILLTAGFWAFANLTNLTVRPRRQRPALVLEDEPQEEV